MKQVMTRSTGSEGAVISGALAWRKVVGVPLLAVLIQWIGTAAVPLIAFSAGLLLLPTA